MPPRDEHGERNYMPTPLRLEEARREGRVPRSGDVCSAVATLAGLVGLAAVGRPMLEAMRDLTAACVDFGGSTSTDPAESLHAATGALVGVLVPLAGLCAAVLVAAVLANLVQVGLVSATSRIGPRWERLSAGEGLRRLFGARSMVRGGLALGKIAAVAGISWVTVAGAWPEMLRAAAGDGGAIVAAAGELTFRLAFRLSAVLLALAALDYLWQRRQHRQDLKMTRREWLDDMRRMEGDPRWRRRRRQASRTRADANPASATVGAAHIGAEEK